MPHRLQPFVLALLLVPALGSAQDPRAEAATERARAALAPIARVVGQWEGEARIMAGPGASMVVRQSEDIVWASSRTVILIRGTGRSSEGANQGAIVFEAAAVIWFDADSNKVRMRSHQGGRSVEAELTVRPDTLTWSFGTAGGQVRYTIAVDAEHWYEVGEFVRPGAAPVRTIEMDLKRVRP